MIVRIAAGLALATGTVLLMVFLHLLGKGPWASPEARHLRAMKDRIAAPAAATPVSAAWMAALPHRAPLARRAAIERRAVVIDGWVRQILWASDGDVHLELIPGPPPGGDDQRYVTAEVTPQFRRRHPAWRYEALAAALRPDYGGATPWPTGPARVRVTGWLLYDFQYDEPLPADATHGRITGWELHPVTAMAVWDTARGGWREVAP